MDSDISISCCILMTIISICRPSRDSWDRAMDRCYRILPCLSDPGTHNFPFLLKFLFFGIFINFGRWENSERGSYWLKCFSGLFSSVHLHWTEDFLGQWIISYLWCKSWIYFFLFTFSIEKPELELFRFLFFVNFFRCLVFSTWWVLIFGSSVSARRSALGLKFALVMLHLIYAGVLFLFDGDLIEKTKREPWYVNCLYIPFVKNFLNKNCNLRWEN